LTIEPISSIELAKFYSMENKNNGLMFHKNLADSAIINEDQGAIYFLMQDAAQSVCQDTNQNLIRFTMKKLSYDQVQLSKPDDILNNDHLLREDLEELRNLKLKVLTYGSNILQKEPLNYLDNFFIEFYENDIINNFYVLCFPQQLSKIVQ